jgi:hypothetical protein
MEPMPETDFIYFGAEIDVISFLPPEIQQEVRTFIYIVWKQNRNITFAPLIPNVSAFLLLYMEPSFAYATIQKMINKSKKDNWYFPLTHQSFLAFGQGFMELCKKYCKNVVIHTHNIGINLANIATCCIDALRFIYPRGSKSSHSFHSLFIETGKKDSRPSRKSGRIY